jgi:methanol metabolism-related c-type cytochrome
MRLSFLPLLLLLCCAAAADAEAPKSSAAVKEDHGVYYDASGNPTYKIDPNGTVDWHTFSGYRRFNGGCEVCHGFDGSGSSFGPNLTARLKTLSYEDFQNIVVNGKQDVNAAQNLVMPAWGTNKNVMCYLDDIYVYLRARSDGALGPGRPAKHQDKPAAATDAENNCMG